MNPLDPEYVIPDGGFVGGPPNPQLNFTMQVQQQSNWCWAACAASVGNFFTPAVGYSQCEVANTCQKKTTCCVDQSECNQVGYLDAAFRAVQSFNTMTYTTDTFSDLFNQIVAGNPVGTRVQWNGQGAHFTLVTGTNPNGEVLTVDDSIHGTTYIPYQNYPNQYHAGGSWTHTYYTQPN